MAHLRTLLSIVAALLLLAPAGCRQAPPQPPDPNEPPVDVDCEDEGAPLTLTHTAADSRLDVPAWFQACALCPPTAIEVVASDAGQDVPLEVAWTDDLRCAVAVAAEPLPDADLLTVDVRLVDGERSGEVSLEIPLPSERGSNPADLGTATWKLELADEDLRVPGMNIDWFLLTGERRDMLLHLGESDADGLRRVTVGVTLDGQDEQDPCWPTSSWLEPARLQRRQLSGLLSVGDVLPTWTGGPVRRGAWQATMSDDGASLYDGAILALLDVNQLEAETGMPPDEICAEWAVQSPGSPCQPCDDPALGNAGLPTCIPLVWEFAVASREAEPLVLVDPEALPEECETVQ